MINRIIDFCAENKFLVILLTAFAVITGWWCMLHLPLDAIPDLSDTQVIVYSRWDRSPDILEDQVTYPIVSGLLSTPGVKAVRGFSDFGYSYVYVIFDEGTDIYWARSRVLEYLSRIIPQLPAGVKTELGPDATALGWVFQYALVDTSGKNDLSQLRSFQDWYLRYQLQAVKGVAEVAPVGGFVRQYQVNVDPVSLQAFGIPLPKLVDAIRSGNNDVGGRLVEFNGREYMVRGRGYAKTTADLESIVIGLNQKSGTPILLKSVASVTLGPDIRRGVAELDGIGQTAGGIVIIRQGENALTVIERIKQKLKEIEPSLPQGVKIVTTYDRSDLILRAIDNLKHTLKEELFVVSLAILIFLLHFPSALIPIVTIPIAVMIAFIPMYFTKTTANIMSLGGIAIAIGAMVDAAIVVVEQTHKKLEHWEIEGRPGKFKDVIISAVKEVGGPSFFSLLVIAVSFLPIFVLEAQEGRLFKPLAYTKTFTMLVAAVLAITLDPVIRLLFTRFNEYNFKPRWLSALANVLLVGKIYSEEKHPISRPLMKLYKPLVGFVLKFPYTVICMALIVILSIIPLFEQIGSEFMPPLHEGSILYMPTTLPGISVTEAEKLLQVQDKILKSFPEVERVFGKIGRSETSTDPAPFSMSETTVILKPEMEWRKVHRWYSNLPEFLQNIFRHLKSDQISYEELIAEMDKAMQFPGVSNAWTMPIKGRIDMLSTGVRTPVGIKVMGSDLKKIEELGVQIEAIVKTVRGTRSAFAERTAGGYFLDFDLKREELARYGLSVADAQLIIMSAIGGDNISTTIEGLERYPINLRYAREYRDDLESLQRVLVPTAYGNVPLAQIADLRLVNGPGMIRNENGMLSGYVYVDVESSDLGGYVEELKAVVREKLSLPQGYTLLYSGQYESMTRVRERLKSVLPLTLFIVFLLLYFNTGSLLKTMIVMLAVPFSAVGAFWLIYLLHYNLSIAVWVGIIALLGIDAETGVFMLLYLDLALQEMKKKGALKTASDLKLAIEHGAVLRLRPKVMTVGVMFLALFPIMWSDGAGADVMKRIAAPMIGGIFTSFIMELLVYPAIYLVWKRKTEVQGD
ncbi:MAG: CusA/CzcA family heavy metal efflux RND transporter [Candidatus Wallbacteria bacterium]|nr:CusA/CzcA family heavy metal efflux RND transporter [Candidatus Wallbacteria bacterium]